MGTREQVSGSQILDDGRSHRTIGRGSRSREHLGDEIGVLGLTGLAEVQLIAHPWRVAFRAVAGLELVRRGDAHGRRGVAPPECASVPRPAPRRYSDNIVAPRFAGGPPRRAG